MLDVLSGIFRVLLAIILGTAVIMVFVSVFRGFRARIMADLNAEHRQHWWNLFARALRDVFLWWLVGFVSSWLLNTLW